PEVLRRLSMLPNIGDGLVKSSAIETIIFEVLADLENDEEKGPSFQSIRQAWDQFDKKKPLKEFTPPSPAEMEVFSDPQLVSFLQSKKSHKLLWGKIRISKIEGIPVSARTLFGEICRIDGISKIQFGGIDGPPHHGPCKVEISAHSNPRQIKGICYDEGKFGGRQAFKIIVRDRTLRDVVLNTLREHLRSLDLLSR
ncbi:MAG: hypothetical protein ABID54_05985, partial [Pseudomonadota bacterium]